MEYNKLRSLLVERDNVLSMILSNYDNFIFFLGLKRRRSLTCACTGARASKTERM